MAVCNGINNLYVAYDVENLPTLLLAVYTVCHTLFAYAMLPPLCPRTNGCRWEEKNHIRRGCIILLKLRLKSQKCFVPCQQAKAGVRSLQLEERQRMSMQQIEFSKCTSDV